MTDVSGAIEATVASTEASMEAANERLGVIAGHLNAVNAQPSSRDRSEEAVLPSAGPTDVARPARFVERYAREPHAR
jgi:uncharacterized protein YciW